jgi:hypothetical protein
MGGGVNKTVDKPGWQVASYLGNVAAGDFHVGPAFIDPVFEPLQHITGYSFVRADRNKSQYRHVRVVLTVHFGAGGIEAVSGTPEDAFDDAAFFLEGVRRQREMDFEAEDEHLD